MEQREEKVTPLPPSSNGGGAVTPRMSRPGLWRAVAGMAVALAVACAIVAFEISHELIHRTTTYRSRISTLNRRMKHLKEEAATSKERLATARKEIAARDRLNAILSAPDVKAIKLAPPNSADVAAGIVKISVKASGAVLTASGLPAPIGSQVYDAWWMFKSAPPAKAAEFRSAIDGTAMVYLDLPPQGSNASDFAVTLEPSGGGIAPTAAVKLRGHVTR
jgi:hypothetical protein